MKTWRVVVCGNVGLPMWNWEGHEECEAKLREDNAAAERAAEHAEKEKRYSKLISAGFEGGAMNLDGRTLEVFCIDANNEPAFFAVDRWRYPEKGLILSGSPGCGKTHLMVGLMLRCAKKWDLEFAFIRFPAWCDQLRSCDFKESEEMLQRAARTGVLVLDDIGAEKLTEHLEAKLCRILDERVEFMRPTFVTTNLDADGIKAVLTERTLSRLRGLTTFLRMKGRDERTTRK